MGTNRFHLSMDSWGTRAIALGMFLFLATNTWHFISAFIPADTFYHRPVMFVFFEGGLLYWFNRLEHASENVGRTLIAAFMTLVQLAAVGFATVYELSLGLQQQMGIHMDATIQLALPWVITGLILLWIIAWALGKLVNHHFGARISYIAKHGVAPHLHGVDVEALTAPSMGNPFLLPGGPVTQPLALPGPEPMQVARPRRSGPSVLQRAGAWVGGLFARPEEDAEDDAQNVAPVSSQPPVTVTPEPLDDVQQPMQTASQPVQQPAPAASPKANLGMIEGMMYDAFMRATPEQQEQLQAYAQAHTLAEVTAYLQAQYPSYAGYITESRVRNVMDAFNAAHPAPEPAPDMQQSAAPRPRAARRKPASTGKASSKSTSAGTKRANMQAILPLLDQANPGLNDADLAKLAGCSASTVSRWRAAQRQPVEA